MILTKLLARIKISEFINSNEGVKAFENIQRDIVTLGSITDYADLPVYADQAAALLGGLTVGKLFRNAIGQVFVKT
jgi:hypothetical protein